MQTNYKRIVLLILLFVTGILGMDIVSAPKTLFARPGILNDWQDIYQASSSDNAAECQMCHKESSGGSNWNAYGWSIRQGIREKEMTIIEAIQAIEELDADGDGHTNLVEINGNTQPGWTEGTVNTIFLSDGSTQTEPPPSTIAQLDLADVEDIDEVRPKLINPIQEGIPNEDTLSIKLIDYADGLLSPLMGTATPSLPDQLFVVDQTGQVWRINLQDGTRSIFLDMSLQLINRGIFEGYSERGLLGFAMHPDYAENGLVYTHSSEPVAGIADYSTMPIGELADHHGIVAQWQVDEPTNPTSRVNSETKKVLLRIDQPQSNHNGGVIAFGPDGMLYIGLGDGGSADDQNELGGKAGHGEDGNGQDLTNPLGTILRIDPLGSNSANGHYGIPPDNPFVGVDGILDEIFAFGLRNPYSFSFDSVEEDLYVGDIGQNDIEEINIIDIGGNYGWPIKEGSFFFEKNGNDPGFVTDQPPGDLPDDLINPIAEYDHDEGKSAIGGFVYRGTAIPELQGRYVFGDWGLDFRNPRGRLFYLTEDETIAEFNIVDRNQLDISVTGFGQDAAGELYLLGNTTGKPIPDSTGARTGVVMRISNATSTDEIPFNSSRYQVYLPTISR